MGLIKDDSRIDHADLPNPIESAEEVIEKLDEAKIRKKNLEKKRKKKYNNGERYLLLSY